MWYTNCVDDQLMRVRFGFIHQFNDPLYAEYTSPKNDMELTVGGKPQKVTPKQILCDVASLRVDRKGWDL